MSTTAKQIERILSLGLATMTAEARRERLEKVVQGRIINGSALASLINECKEGLMLVVEMYGAKIENGTEIKTMLDEIDGKTAVASVEPDELVDMVLELRRKITERAIK